jgi:galactose-1-phosphate uridylyltransferase (family 1)
LSDLFLQPHRRYNQLTDEWVLVSAGRSNRPWLGAQETQADDRPAYDPGCCLCPGNTRASGATNPAYTDAFVFTNDFPALRPEASAEATASGSPSDGAAAAAPSSVSKSNRQLPQNRNAPTRDDPHCGQNWFKGIPGETWRHAQRRT